MLNFKEIIHTDVVMMLWPGRRVGCWACFREVHTWQASNHCTACGMITHNSCVLVDPIPGQFACLRCLQEYEEGEL